MRNLAAFACLGMLVVSVAVACAGDDRVKHLSDGGAGGLGDGGLGGFDGVGQGGGSSNPAAGGGGAPSLAGGGLGGAPEVNPNGGTGAPSPVEEGGTSSVAGGGGGGSPAVDCPAQTGKFTHQCADAVTTWAPIWNNSLDRFELLHGALPFPLASGTISFFYNNADSQQCDTVPIQVTANGIVAPVTLQFIPIAVRITTFTFTDVCGNTHEYDAAGVPACNDIRGSGTGFGSYVLACNTRLDSNCPEACN